MKRAIIVFGVYKKEFRSQLYDHYHTVCPKEFSKYLREYPLQIPFDPKSPLLQEAIELLEKNSIRYRLGARVHYTKKELDSVRYFHVVLPHPLEMEGATLYDYESNYVDRCPNCGFGGTLIGDALVDRKFMKKAKIGVLSPELFVSEEVKNLIESHGLTGVTFGPLVKDYKGRDMAPFYVMRVQSILPPANESTFIEPDDSKYKDSCGHHIPYLLSDLQYNTEKLSHALDFNLTHEYFDNDVMRKLVVSARVKNLFQENNIRVYHYEPVALL